jgi:hypothetical protein
MELEPGGLARVRVEFGGEGCGFCALSFTGLTVYYQMQGEMPYLPALRCLSRPTLRLGRGGRRFTVLPAGKRASARLV